MTIFVYIMLAMLTALMLVCSVVIVFRAGEKELLCKYGYISEEDKNEHIHN